MRDLSPIALRGDLLYLLPTTPSFWRWSADGQWIEWADGKTIAHHNELLAVLSRLTPDGLPLIESILLIMAATMPSWGEERTNFLADHYAADTDVPGVADALIARRLRVDAAATLQKLDTIAALPPALRNSPAAKASLVDFIFQKRRPISPGTAGQVVLELTRGLDAETLAGHGDDDAFKRLGDALHALDLALDRVDGDVVELWQKTGIDFDLAPAVVPLPVPKQTRNLLRQLRDDDELAGIANVAADVLAAIHLPRRLNPDPDLPAGGVSDVSNKGNLDQLLLSELVHDDLTLAVRVAMGEALYLRREAPARHPPVGRWIVLDSGIRLWGAARLFATSVGLALVAGGDERSPHHVFRANGDRLEPVCLTQRAGVVNHLAGLTPSPDPLPAVREAVRQIRSAIDSTEQNELILVTHEQTAADPAVLAALQSLAGETLLIRLATVTADGSFQLFALAAGARRELCAAQLSFEILSATKPLKLPTIAITNSPLPAILQLPEFPLFLPARMLMNACVWDDEAGLIGVSSDRRLMAWGSPDRGPVELTDCVPKGIIRAVLYDCVHYTVTVVAHDSHRNRTTLFAYRMGDREHYSVEVVGASFEHVTLDNCAVLLIGSQSILSIAPLSTVPHSYPIPKGFTWHSGRYFRDGRDNFLAATSTGLVEAGHFHRPIHIIDHEEIGPILMRWMNRYEPQTDRPPISIPNAESGSVLTRSVTTSPDGRRLIATQLGAKGWQGVDLDAGQRQVCGSRDRAQQFLLGETAVSLLNTSYRLQHRANSVGRTADGSIALRRVSKPKSFRLAPDGAIHVSTGQAETSSTLNRSFQDVDSLPGSLVSLRRAAWNDGSAICMDGRGLVHLMSSSPQLPQITLTLPADDRHPVAGWLSTGQVFGPTYYTGKPGQIDSREVWELILQFTARLQ